MPATPTRTEYLVLGGLMLASRAINFHGYDWVTSRRKRGSTWLTEQTAGRKFKTPVDDSLRGLLKGQLVGRFDHATDADVADQRAGVWAAWDLVKAKADVDTLQTLQLVRGGGLATLSGDCIVYDLEKVSQDAPDIWNVVLDVELPDGPLT